MPGKQNQKCVRMFLPTTTKNGANHFPNFDNDDGSDNSNTTTDTESGSEDRSYTQSKKLLRYDGTDWFIDKDTPIELIVKHTEMQIPLRMPMGCGPVACGSWFKIGNTEKIVGMRDQILMNEMGVTLGDQTFKRCYQRAYQEIKRYERLSDSEKKQCAEARRAGIEDPNRNPTRRYIPELDERSGKLKPVRRIRTPYWAIVCAFGHILDKHWHRYLFPFGCYWLDRGSAGDASSQGWKEWLSDMPKKNNLVINPHSVTCADILYLCNTVGYLERLIYVAVIILWAKGHGVNLMIHGIPRSARLDMEDRGHDGSAYDQFISLEKHMFVFGCLHNHRSTLSENKMYVGGNWANEIMALENVEKKMYRAFGINNGELKNDFERFMIRDIKGNASALTTVFKRSQTISDHRK